MLFQRLPVISPVLFSTSLVGLLLAGCPGGTPTNPTPSAPAATASIDADACEHFEKGPSSAVTATDSASATSPLVSSPHSRFDITLPGSGDRQGFVRFTVSKAGDYTMFLNKTMDLKVLNDARTPVTAETTATSAAGCATAKARHVYPLTIGTYYVQIGPTVESLVSFVAIGDDGDAHVH
jgi:hypothetical protein